MAIEDTQSVVSEKTQTIEPFRYAVVDLALMPELRPVVTGQFSTVAVTLLGRNMPRRLLEVGPWLIRLSRAAEVENALDRMEGTAWGYYLYSTYDLASLRQSLRRFNLAQLPDRKDAVLFRYWDPRVMQVFLEVATKAQRERFFNLIERLTAPDGRFDEAAPSSGGGPH